MLDADIAPFFFGSETVFDGSRLCLFFVVTAALGVEVKGAPSALEKEHMVIMMN